MTVLADTSIWVDYFRGSEPAAGDLETMLDEDAIVICGPVVAELIAGAVRNERENVRHALGGLAFAEIDYRAWREAGELSAQLRDVGSFVPLLDVVIAVAAIRADAAVWTRDRDFDRIADVTPLKLHEAA